MEETSGVGSLPAAPEPTGVAVATKKRRPATSRGLWLGVYGLVVLFIVLRAPLVYGYVSDRIPPNFSAEVGDEEMEELAIRAAVFVGLVLTCLIIACYFALAAVLEKRLFPAAKSMGKRVTVGLYFLVVTTSVLPPQVASLVLGIPNVRASLWYYVYLVVVAGALPWFYRGAWRRESGRRKAAILFASFGVAILTVVG